MQYIDTIDDANDVLQSDEKLGLSVKNDVEILLNSYHLESLEHGRCTYGGCVMILEFDELKKVIDDFKNLDITIPEFVDIFVCSDGSICIHLLYIYATDYSISLYMKGEKK